MGLLTRFKSNEKLQAEALDILTEMIRRNLLTASVYISDPACFFVQSPRCVSCGKPGRNEEGNSEQLHDRCHAEKKKRTWHYTHHKSRISIAP